ncbi:hypothetical protein JCM10908_000880 [Rhodotorula pacifica]|uniref:uncharacterized protein n=1 Tax=Rhodotorula pacifica TaxID=1495444 RepID=UPI00317F0342
MSGIRSGFAISPTQLLSDIIKKRPYIAPRIHHLDVKQPDPADYLFHNGFSDLIEQLTCLETLAFAEIGPDLLAEFLYTEPSVLPITLRSLTLICHGVTWYDPYHPDHLTELGKLAHLETLILDLRSETIPKGRNRRATSNFVFPQLKYLEIGLPYKGTSSILRLLPLFPKLEHLHLRSSSPSPDFQGAISALKMPSLIKTLHLDAQPHKNWVLPAAISNLSKLETLGLHGRWQRLDDTAFASLSHAPLRNIAIGPDTDIGIAQLKNLVAGSGRIPTLQELRLDNLRGKRGEADKSRAPWRSWAYYYSLLDTLSTWTRPQWTAQFSCKSLLALHATAKAANVRLTGSCLQALEIEEDIERLERWAKDAKKRMQRRERLPAERHQRRLKRIEAARKRAAKREAYYAKKALAKQQQQQQDSPS